MFANYSRTIHSCPYTPQQNGRAERKHRHIVETGLAMLFNAHVPSSYWVHAFSSAVYIVNRLPTPFLQNKSPFELIFHRVPTYANFRPFGYRVYPYLRDYADHKLSPRSLPCVFLGYCSQYKGYRCLEPASSRTYITRHAKFDEQFFPFTSDDSQTPIGVLDLTIFLDDAPCMHAGSSTTPSDPPSSSPTPTYPCRLCDESLAPPDASAPAVLASTVVPPTD
ncbi:hypothetical protein L1887_40745 [Cichorium endivia]|nr:hypothetical protein L1887_40745 [Cichorium endivia]